MKKVFEIVKKVLSILCECIIPVLPIMIGVGMIKVLLIIVGPIVLNLLNETDSTYIVLNFVAEAGYYFMPIYIGFSAAEIFKTQKYLGGLVGAMLISPTFVEIVKTGTPLTFLKLPIALTDYGNQILSSFIAVWIMSYIYKFFEKYIPNFSRFDSINPIKSDTFMLIAEEMLKDAKELRNGGKTIEADFIEAFVWYFSEHKLMNCSSSDKFINIVGY